MLAGALCLCLSAQPVTVLADVWERVGNTYQMADGTGIPGVLSRGIDTSYWNQEIDWEQVREDDVDFVMLGTRFRGEVDPYFLINAQAAHEAGIQVGAYLYSYATSVKMAEQEADFVLDLIKDYPISYPVAFDAEDNNTLGSLTPSQVSQCINAFCRKIEDAGYYPMVYANEYWLNHKIDLSMIDYDIWVARYNVMYTYDSPSMWQATNTGSVRGIDGDVDINFLFTDYSRIIPADTWRTIGENTYYYKDHWMQKASWIHDGTGWFYLNEEGNPSRGWMIMPEGRYYLDPADGRMASGWQQLDGSWYYFRDSGLMATGWRDVNGTWYYMNQEGRMETGWQEIGGKRYYLSSSGAMETGWQQLDGNRYYFQPSGEMAVGWVNADGCWYYLNSNGHMETGWKNINGCWYYLNDSGVMETGWQTINGSLYYLDPAGGQMAANMELELNGIRYYADGTGACAPAAEAGETAAGADSGAGNSEHGGNTGTAENETVLDIPVVEPFQSGQ